MMSRKRVSKFFVFGGSHNGSSHWWAQRFTAVALIPLLLWLVASIISLLGASQVEVKTWIGTPVVAILLIFTFGFLFHHTQLGLQVVLEDYVHIKWLKVASIRLVKGMAVLLFAVSVLAIVKIYFSG